MLILINNIDVFARGSAQFQGPLSQERLEVFSGNENYNEFKLLSRSKSDKNLLSNCGLKIMYFR